MEINIELLRESDFETIVKWINKHNEDFMVQWAGPTFTFPLTVEQMQNHYQKGINSVNADVFIYKITETSNREMIGTLQLCRFDSINNEAVIGRFLIGDSKYRGIGTSLKKVVQIGFKRFNLKRIRLNIYDINDSAIRCYKRVGFMKGKITENVYTSSRGIQWNNYEIFLDKESFEDYLY